MNKIQIPEYINSEYYKHTINFNPEIIPDGFYMDPKKNDEYLKDREELINNYELTFYCDEWLNIFCFQTPNTHNKVPIKKIPDHIKKYYGKDIPLGHLMLAIKHRKERHTLDPNGKILSLYIDKKAYDEYLTLYG